MYNQRLNEPMGQAKDVQAVYKLKVWQQPERARLCSFKEENDTIDRRPIDPPPVVELQSFNTDLTEIRESAPFFIRASIVHPNPVDTVSGPEYQPVKTPTGADATAGEVIQTPEKLKGLDGLPGSLVIFAKLSVRVPGIFRLKFTLYETTDSGISEITFSVSEPFEVFSPKLFKGMKESTPLTRHLAGQGLKIKLRTDTTVGRQSDSRRRPSNAAASRSTSSIPVPSSSSPDIPRPPSQHSPRRSAMHLPHHNSPTSRHTPPYISHSNSSHSSHPLDRPHHPLPARSLVWHSNSHMNSAFPEASSSRGSSPQYNDRDRRRIGADDGMIPSPLNDRDRRMIGGDDGMIPSLFDMSSRLSYTATPPRSDLSAFSLNNDIKRTDPSPVTSSSRTSSAASRPYSPFSNSSTSLQSKTSSARSESPAGLPPFINRLDIGTGDDGIPNLSSILRPMSGQSLSQHPQGGPVLPPLPSFLTGGSSAGPMISPPNILPPIRGSLPGFEYDKQTPKN